MKPPSTSDPVTSAARQTIRPTGDSCRLAAERKLIVAHEMPKSPCSAALHVLDVLHDRRPVGAEAVLRLRDLLRRRVLDVDEEPGRVRGHLQVDANVSTESRKSSTIATPSRRRM